MAFHLVKSNALLVEPIRCGTTWMAHALRAASIETQQPETVGQCCHGIRSRTTTRATSQR